MYYVSFFFVVIDVIYIVIVYGIASYICIKLTSDDHDFDNSIVVAFTILLFFLNLSFDLGSLASSEKLQFL